jgi:hypothetical protein
VSSTGNWELICLGDAKKIGAAAPFTSTVAPANWVGRTALLADAVVPSVRELPKIEKITPGASEAFGA